MVSGAKDAFEKSFMRSVAKNVDRRWRFPLLQVALLIRARRVASHWTAAPAPRTVSHPFLDRLRRNERRSGEHEGGNAGESCAYPVNTGPTTFVSVSSDGTTYI